MTAWLVARASRRSLHLAAACLTTALAACADIDNSAAANAYTLTGGGDAHLGKLAIRQFGCGSSPA